MVRTRERSFAPVSFRRMPNPFAHLHVHSHYSLLAGAWAPAEIAHRTARLGMDAVALTDTDGLYGAVPFAKACETAGVRPILGAELTDPERPYRAVFLARDPAGYEELCALVTARHLEEGFGLKRAVGNRSQHLAVLTRDHRLLEAAVAGGRREGTYAEVRPAPGGAGLQAAAERALKRETLAWASRLAVPPVATAGVYYAEPARRDAHKVLCAIAARTTLAALDALQEGGVAPETAWFQPPETLAAAFADCPQALANGADLAARCRFAFEWGRHRFPLYPSATGESAFAMLWRLAFEGLTRRYRPLPAEAILRLQEELAVIEEKGFADYFLVIRDITRWAAGHRIPSVGRGSAANSLVSYCLGITHVDPLAHNLFFERFLNRERADPPDFDLDFCWRRRDRVIDYVYERYGPERVAMIATFCRLGARGALREVARALGIPDREISRVTGRVPHFSSVEMLESLRETLPECRGLPLDRPPWDEVVRLALQIDMYPRHLSVHPGGIVIGPEPLETYLPRQRAAKGVVVTQFDMHPVEELGLVKIDLLGNRGLSAIADVCDQLLEEEGIEIRWQGDEGDGCLRAGPTIREVDPFSDEATRRLMREGRTMGCFYIESPGMRALLRKLRCDSFEMLTAASSIIRPGIADSGMMKAFIDRFHGDEPVVHLHPVMEELLADTFGVMIYQEDVIKVVHRLAGMSLGEADGMRRAMSKKGDYEDMEAYRARFLDGARANSVEPGAAREIWRQIESFAGYSFCKAHSASYAQVSFRSAWLKTHEPARFMASVLANGGGFYAAFAYVEEARRMGLEIRLPDVNKSGATWRAEGSGAIRAGLEQVAEVHAATVEGILAERAGGGAFVSLGDFCARVTTRLAGARVPEIHRLIDAGCFDAFDLTRPQAKWKAEVTLRGWAGRVANDERGHPGERGTDGAGAETLFPKGTWRGLRADLPPVPALADYPAAEQRRREWELLGVSPHHHPIEFHREAVEAVRMSRGDQGRHSGGRTGSGAPAIVAGDLARYRGERVTLVGFLTTTKRVRTKRAEPMMFLTLEDETDIYDVVLFPRVYQRYGSRLTDRGPYVVTGRIEDDPHPSSVTAERLERLAEGAKF
ncbi:MAG TPA: DNA polymerase III subunit alpha [Gemmatimonadota bacterium]|nr:DNA polymerase III subunit alpha [Gemmatimonadota bacterium]